MALNLRKLESERIPFGLLVVWCLLPLAMAVACIFLGVTGGYTQYDIVIPYGLLYSDVTNLYRRAFLLLGAITLLYALSQIAFCWNAITSKLSVRRQPWIYILLLLLGWSIVSTLLSDDPIAQFSGTRYRCDGLFSYFIYLAVFICAMRIQSDKLKKRVFILFIMVTNILSLVMLGQATRVPVIYQCFESPYAAIFNQFNHFGYILCMSSLCAAGLYLHDESTRTKAVGLASFTLQVFTLIINDTFGCYLAVIAGLAAIVLFWHLSGHKVQITTFAPVFIFVVLSVLSFTGAFAPIRPNGVGNNFFQLFIDVAAINEGSDAALRAGTGRMKLWSAALAMIPDRPIFGYGPEGLTGDYAAAVGVDRPHNELIQYAVFLGIPALLMYLSALITLFVRQWRNMKQLSGLTIVAAGVVVGYVTSSLFGNTMFNTVPYYWMMLSFAACLPQPEMRLFGNPECSAIASELEKQPKGVRVFFYAALLLLAADFVWLALTL